MTQGSPRQLRLLVAGVTIAGGAVVGSAMLHPSVAELPAVWKLAGAGLAFFLGDLAVLHFRYGRQQHSFTWAETALVVGLVLLTSPWLRIVAPVAVLAQQLVARRPLSKALFNAGSAAVGVFLARLAYNAVTSEPAWSAATAPVTWVGLGVGTFVFFLWNYVSVSVAIALSQGLLLRAVATKGLPLSVLVYVGNTAAGIIFVTIAASKPAILALLPVLGVVLFAVYRAYHQAIEDRDTWEVLQAASHDLLGATRNELAHIAVDRARSLFKADFVELMLVDPQGSDRATVWRRSDSSDVEATGQADSLGATFWPRARCELELFTMTAPKAPGPQRAEMEELGLERCVVAPLITQGRCLGTLRIGFARFVRLRERHLQVVRTFVNQVSAAVSSATLFEDTAEERETLHRIVENSWDGIFSVDGGGRVLSWNAAMERATDRAATGVLQGPIASALDAVTVDGTAVTSSWVIEQLEGSDQSEALVCVTTARGKRWLSLSFSTVRGGEGEIAFAVGVARDVTAAREVELAKQDFVATVSHELRTPLTPIKGFLMTLLRDDVNLESDQVRYVHGRMLEQAQRLERLIEDLLTISQLDRGSFRVDRAEVVIDDVVSRVCAETPRPVEVRVPEGLTAQADAGRVEQVLSNLLGNAHKYSPPDRRIEVRAEEHDGEIVISVRDEGDGIPTHEQDAVFERFCRLGNHMTRASGGTGLGLYIARCLVEAMGGRIWVESAPGTGSCFRFTLPAGPGAGREEAAPERRLVAVS